MTTSVNVPTNTKIKEQDVNQKLQLYGIYSAFANGKVPSNKQIDVALNSALASRALSKPSPKLSSEGQHLVADLRDVIEKAKVLLLTKNEGNLIQDFIYQSGQAGTGSASKPGAPVDKDTAKQHGNEALEGMRTLGQLLISNGQFRKLLNDAMILFRDIAGDGAQNAATRFKPGEDQLSQIDKPADDNTWHDVPSASGMRGQMRDQYNKNKPFGKDGAKSAMSDAQASTEQTGGTGQDQAASGATTGAKNLTNQASANIPEERKQQGRQAMDKSKAYMSEKMPKERREQIIWRLKKMVVEIQGHSDYQRAIDTLLRLAETYQGHATNVGQQSKGSVQGAHTDVGLKNVEADLKILLERFANSTSSDDLFDSINQIYRDADQDPELKNFFKDLDGYIRKALKEQGYLLEAESTTQYNRLYDQGNFLLRDRYRSHTNRIIDEFKFFGDQFDQDPYNKAFAASVQKLFTGLGNDENGKPTFKPHLLKDLGEVIVPGIFEHVRYVPIPRIEYSDPMADAVIENLIIEGDNLAPNVFEFSTDNFFRWGRKSIKSSNKNKVMMSVSGIQMDLKDVSYYVKKKQGFPSITDKGVMDIFLGGSGFSFKAAMETADKSDKNHFFKVNNVTVDIKHMKIQLKQSKYKLLFGLVKPLLMLVMKPILQKVISAQIKDNINKLDAFCYEIDAQAKRAAAEAKNNPEDAQNIYKRYVTAAQKRMTQSKQKKEETAKKSAQDKQVNVAMTQHDSIFKDVSLPGGISSKATEYKDLARKGDKWESPVFAIGSAKESSGLPKATQVTRKQHGTAPIQKTDVSQSNHGADTSATRDYSGAGGSGFGSRNAPSTGLDGGSSAQPNGTTGFSNQVNSAFDNGADLSLKDQGQTTTMVNQTGTSLGTSNPVLSGSV